MSAILQDSLGAPPGAPSVGWLGARISGTSMASISAGILAFRRREARTEVLLVHPGGPFFRNRDDGAWSIPKGLVDEGETDGDAALRELEEETGFVLPSSVDLVPLGEVRQKGGKRVRAWAAEASFDVERLDSNTFEIEWPPRSGRRRRFPEVDRAAYFDLETARRRILEAQAPFLERLAHALERSAASAG